MPYYTTIPEVELTEQAVDTFYGYNHNAKIGEGELYDMTNLCSDNYPLLSTRERRGIISGLKYAGNDITITSIYGSCFDGEGNLFIVCKVTGTGVPSTWSTDAQLIRLNKSGNYATYDNFTELSKNRDRGSYSTESPYEITLTDSDKQMFADGKYLYIFPDQVYTGLIYSESDDVVTMECDIMNVGQDVSGSTSITLTPCKADGTAYTGQTVSATEPSSPSEGDIWVDTSEDTSVWKKYKSSEWITMSDVYVKVNISTVNRNREWVREGDGVTLYMMPTASDPNYDTIIALNGTHIIIKSDDDLNSYVVITGLIDNTITFTSSRTILRREIPEMDYVIQAQNRLWGCKWQTDPLGNNINELYASKLGDFFNWNVFQGISTDSYTASIGTPGAWTGAINIGGYPTFFKEDHLHKVYVSSSGAHQIVDKPCKGVQSGSSGSLAMVGDVCYYKSKNGVMAYDGSSFSDLSSAFGNVFYTDADGGCVEDKYYLSMKTGSTWSMFAYDTTKGLWHREDSTHALCFSSYAGDSFYFTEASNVVSIYVMSDTVVSNYESTLPWEAVTGMLGYSYTGQKYISRFNIRMSLPYGSSMEVYVEYDSSGEWVHQGHVDGKGTTSFTIPVRPRRCDHFRIKLSGTGEFKIYSFSKLFEGGSDIL